MQQQCRAIFLLTISMIFLTCSTDTEKQLTKKKVNIDKKVKLHDIKFSSEIEREIKSGKLSESSAAYYYSYIGNYQKSLENYELPLDWDLDKISSKDSTLFKSYQVRNAFNYLSNRTVEEQIVIISEAHHKPQHRLFTRKLLKTLYRNGFRYLGIETLTPSYGNQNTYLMDTLLNLRGYPLNSPITGFYSREPQMGNMIREAISLGFEIFGYERTSKENERDLQQALNIAKFMEQNQKGKTVIHCGWYHAIESDYPKRQKDNYMAYHLKEIIGIDPLTIYQDILSEKTKTPESPYYKLIDSKEISVLLDKENKPFTGFGKTPLFDILLYHPRTEYIKNRPDWLLTIEGNKLVPIQKNWLEKQSFPIIVKAYLVEDLYSATPIDIIELKHSEDETQLILRKGRYRIVLIDSNRNEIEYEIKVE